MDIVILDSVCKILTRYQIICKYSLFGDQLLIYTDENYHYSAIVSITNNKLIFDSADRNSETYDLADPRSVFAMIRRIIRLYSRLDYIPTIPELIEVLNGV